MAGWYPTAHRTQADKLGFMASTGDWLGSLGESIDSGLESLGDTAMDVAATTVAPLMQHAASQITPFELPSWDQLTGRSAQSQVPQTISPTRSQAPADPFAGTSATVPRSSTDSTPFSLPSWSEITGSRTPAPATPARTAAVQPSAASVQPAATPPAAPSGPAPAAGGDLQAYARSVAQRYGVDPDIFVRQIQQESGFNPKARSPAGALGIAQFMPGTAQAMGLADPMEPYSALDAAARHMKQNLDANKGDYRFALAAYNAGQGNVNKWGEGVFGADFASGQTRDYVNVILGPGAATNPAMGRPAQKTAPAPSPAPVPSAAPTPGEPGGPPLQTTAPVWQPPAAAPAQSPPPSLDALPSAFKRVNGRMPTLDELQQLVAAAYSRWTS